MEIRPRSRTIVYFVYICWYRDHAHFASIERDFTVRAKSHKIVDILERYTRATSTLMSVSLSFLRVGNYYAYDGTLRCSSSFSADAILCSRPSFSLDHALVYSASFASSIARYGSNYHYLPSKNTTLQSVMRILYRAYLSVQHRLDELLTRVRCSQKNEKKSSAFLQNAL